MSFEDYFTHPCSPILLALYVKRALRSCLDIVLVLTDSDTRWELERIIVRS